MKKIIVLILALLALSLCACGGNTEATETTENIETTLPETEAPVCEHVEKGEFTVKKAGIFTEGQKKLVCLSCGEVFKEVTLPATKSVKILAIGNSFSIDATTFMYDLFKAAGVEDVIVGNAHISGCSIEKHYQMAQSGEQAYSYTKYTANGKENKDSSLFELITDEEWDIITLQQASQYSGIPETYADLSSLISYVLDNCTNLFVDLKFHMTWAYEQSTNHGGFKNYDRDQMTMYKAIANTVQEVVLKHSEITGIIPSGTAIQNLRTSYLGDTLTRDGYHLSNDIGRYTAGLTWVSYITGVSPDEISWVPPSHGNINEDLPPIREAVKNAISTPFDVTESQIKEKKTLTLEDYFAAAGLDIDDFELLDWEPRQFYFWNSTSSTKMSKASSMPQYTGSSKRFTKEEIPVGSVIVVDKGYQYRPEGWQTADEKNANKRPSNCSTYFTIVDEAWWDNYTLRAFNLSKLTGNDPATEEDATHFNIYIPKK